MRALLLPLVLASPSASVSTPVHALTAGVEANGYSFSFQVAATNAGFSIFFTTYDGSSGSPLEDCSGDFCTVSSEVAPAGIGSVAYRTDYFAVDQLGTFEYGAASISLSATDGDGDGILDPLERTRSGNFAFTGSTTPHFNAFGIYVTSTVSGSVQRSANSLVGTYSGSFSNSTQSASFAGAYSLSGASGTVEYQLGGEILDWHLMQRGLDGTLRTFTAISQFERIGVDAITVPSFALYDSASSLALLVNGVTLQRSGSIFRGTVTLADGGVDTSWPDYTTYRVELTDPNDTDFDGLPDLVSVPEADAASSSLLVVVRSQRQRALCAAPVDESRATTPRSRPAVEPSSHPVLFLSRFTELPPNKVLHLTRPSGAAPWRGGVWRLRFRFSQSSAAAGPRR